MKLINSVVNESRDNLFFSLLSPQSPTFVPFYFLYQPCDQHNFHLFFLLLYHFLSSPPNHLNFLLHPSIHLSKHSSLPSSLTPPAQKGLLHLSPDVYQEMEASRKQGGSAPGPGGNSGSVNYMTSKDMGPCSAPLPPGHPPYYSGSASSPSPTATMARELLLNGQSPTAEASLPMKGKNSALACGVSVQPAQQLDYLARIQGFQVRYKEADMLLLHCLQT